MVYIVYSFIANNFFFVQVLISRSFVPIIAVSNNQKLLNVLTTVSGETTSEKNAR